MINYHEEHNEQNDSPAFPAQTPGGYCTPGLTKREWFAGMALTGLLAKERLYTDAAADDAVKFADALIARLDWQPDTTTAQQIAMGIGGGK